MGKILRELRVEWGSPTWSGLWNCSAWRVSLPGDPVAKSVAQLELTELSVLAELVGQAAQPVEVLFLPDQLPFLEEPRLVLAQLLIPVVDVPAN